MSREQSDESKSLLGKKPLVDLEEIEVDPNPTPYEKASFFNIIHYIYVLKSLWRLRKKRNQTLTLEDLPRIGKNRRSES